jgi:hypothetical protein
MLDVATFVMPMAPLVGLLIGISSIFQRAPPSPIQSYFCSAPFSPTYVGEVWRPWCLNEVRVREGDVDEDSILWICERCGQPFDWLGILTRLVKECPECKRCIEMDKTTNFCGKHGDRQVRMRVKEVSKSYKYTG